jgi:NADH dehydrogenase [ubiquinone] 1 alpha subcomplex assembly factor 1
MILFFLINFIPMIPDPLVLVDFSSVNNSGNWQVVDDVVMGGRSNGNFIISKDGHGVFYGRVSLENNGGFSSLRYRCETLPIGGFTKAIIKLRGDGKKYQFRLKSSQDERHAYIAIFQTTGNWQTVEINLAEMYPAFRGMKVNLPNYPAKQLEEIAFLIGNKVEEDFRLEIAAISLVAD